MAMFSKQSNQAAGSQRHPFTGPCQAALGTVCVMIVGCTGSLSDPPPTDAGMEPPAERCKAMDAKGNGPCTTTFGVRWDGRRCVPVSGCTCEGPACGVLHRDTLTCWRTHGICTGCGPTDAREAKPCGPLEDPAQGFVWDGSRCQQLKICHCEGSDCDRLFVSPEACLAAHSGCVPGGCVTDADCQSGSQWCEDGRCVACDNSGTVCRIECPTGWQLYQRNGCAPCDCAPPNECVQDSDCPGSQVCYPGLKCWEGCVPGDPDCCRGNVCSAAGCSLRNPTGCLVAGCPNGLQCVLDQGCAPSTCVCGLGGWTCTSDCGGGTCVR